MSCKSLIRNKVPDQWLRRSYLSVKSLANYISNLLSRLEFFRKWIEAGEPQVYHLPYFYFPQAFVNSIKLNYSRHAGVPIDSILCDFQVTRFETNLEDEQAPAHGVFAQVNYHNRMECLSIKKRIFSLIIDRVCIWWDVVGIVIGVSLVNPCAGLNLIDCQLL